MQIIRNLILVIVIFVVSAMTIIHFIPGSEIDESKLIVLEEENGKVLGVSEEVGEEVDEEKRIKSYLKISELDNVLPVVDKSNFAPEKKEETSKLSHGAGSILALDVNSGKVLYSYAEDKERSIASITKLATALVLMDLGLDWNSEYEIQASDHISGGRIYVYQGEVVKLKDLLYASLVASANTATQALVSASGFTQEEFVDLMNQKADFLDLEKTSFVDPIGLSSWNTSTAYEVSVLLSEALRNPTIRDCVSRESYVFTTKSGKSKTVKSTDILLDDFEEGDIRILGGKTGFTGAAGYCFVSMFENLQNKRVITVVLGSHGHADRFEDTKHLINWVYANYEWKW
ncbi:hypothetical protein C0583_04690 [Candidatus Parcubacteria bacterium]|nr:MAG: hypothetical protein C0583_04690 [Candidatus Parcubacteria bacterium]